MSQSHACCTVPPIVTEGYKEKGEWITIEGMKTYATGPKDAKQAILVVVCVQCAPSSWNSSFSR